MTARKMRERRIRAKTAVTKNGKFSWNSGDKSISRIVPPLGKVIVQY
jgi:hypothetical protein